MGVSEKLTKEVKGISILVIIIVVMSIVLLRFNSVDGAYCSSPYTYNATLDGCYVATNASQNTTVSTLGNKIVESVSALDEPITWISIVVIIIVVGWLMFYLKGKKSGMG